MANTSKADDVVKDYIEWAVTHDFGVIDVNIPKHITTNTVRICGPLFLPTQVLLMSSVIILFEDPGRLRR